MKYDEAITKIEDIAKKLDSNIELEEGISLFNESVNICKDCIQKLNDTKGKITEITKELNEFVEKELNIEGQ
jgi:exodeoxyribonuclease VII small subunit